MILKLLLDLSLQEITDVVNRSSNKDPMRIKEFLRGSSKDLLCVPMDVMFRITPDDSASTRRS